MRVAVKETGVGWDWYGVALVHPPQKLPSLSSPSPHLLHIPPRFGALFQSDRPSDQGLYVWIQCKFPVQYALVMSAAACRPGIARTRDAPTPALAKNLWSV